VSEVRSAFIVLRLGDDATGPNAARFLFDAANIICARLTRGDSLLVTEKVLTIWLDHLLPGLSLAEVKASLGQSLARQLSFETCAESKAQISLIDLPDGALDPKTALEKASTQTRRLFAF
jgi:hypothetical protein